MKTGFTDLDKHIGGFNGGELIILGGRPGMGKTSLAVDIVRNCGGKTLFISIEPFSAVQRQRIGGHVYSMAEYPQPPSPNEIRRVVLLCKDEIDLVIVDYIQLLETKEPIRELKEMAQTINKPILALSQLDRIGETRKGYRPRIDDLRRIDAEHISCIDKALLLYRSYYYFCDASTSIAELIIYRNQQETKSKTLLRYETSAEGMVFFDYTPHSASHHCDSFLNLLYQVVENEKTAEAVADSLLAFLSPQTSSMDSLMKIKRRLEYLHTEYPNNASIASAYAEGLFFLAEGLNRRGSTAIYSETLKQLKILADKELLNDNLRKIAAGFLSSCVAAKPQ